MHFQLTFSVLCIAPRTIPLSIDFTFFIWISSDHCFHSIFPSLYFASTKCFQINVFDFFFWISVDFDFDSLAHGEQFTCHSNKNPFQFTFWLEFSSNNNMDFLDPSRFLWAMRATAIALLNRSNVKWTRVLSKDFYFVDKRSCTHSQFRFAELIKSKNEKSNWNQEQHNHLENLFSYFVRFFLANFAFNHSEEKKTDCLKYHKKKYFSFQKLFDFFSTLSCFCRVVFLANSLRSTFLSLFLFDKKKILFIFTHLLLNVFRVNQQFWLVFLFQIARVCFIGLFFLFRFDQ